jgi:hypothetical protein
VRFVRDAGQDDARTALAGGQAGDCLTQQALAQLGKEMFLEDLDAAVLPGFADAMGEWRNRVQDKMP